MHLARRLGLWIHGATRDPRHLLPPWLKEYAQAVGRLLWLWVVDVGAAIAGLIVMAFRLAQPPLWFWIAFWFGVLVVLIAVPIVAFNVVRNERDGLREQLRSSRAVVQPDRPGYFPEHGELAELLEAAAKGDIYVPDRTTIHARLLCVQLMEDAEVVDFIEKFVGHESREVLKLLESNESLRDLVRRPVLAAMICTAKRRLADVDDQEVTVRRLYELHTNDWIEREEDKTPFRLLIDGLQKSRFMRYLAMQMHMDGKLGIHFSELDEQIGQHFELTDVEAMDHFSHDIRTCSFLNRDDSGFYRFIHKSFMEYFVALEFEKLDNSPFSLRFERALTPEMIEFLCTDEIIDLIGFDPDILVEIVTDAIEYLMLSKDIAVKSADYELAAGFRDHGERLRKMTESGRAGFFQSMKRQWYSDQIDRVARTLVDTEKMILESGLSGELGANRQAYRTVGGQVELDIGCSEGLRRYRMRCPEAVSVIWPETACRRCVGTPGRRCATRRAA